MPFVYSVSLATAGNLTTNGTANTETETLFIKPGSTATVGLQMFGGHGKGASQTSLSAIEMRCGLWATASTSGTGLAMIARTGGAPSVVATGSSRSTAGSTRTNAGPIVGFGVTSKDFWRTQDPDEMVMIRAGNAGSIFVADVGSVASLVFEFSAEIREF